MLGLHNVLFVVESSAFLLDLPGQLDLEDLAHDRAVRGQRAEGQPGGAGGQTHQQVPGEEAEEKGDLRSAGNKGDYSIK